MPHNSVPSDLGQHCEVIAFNEVHVPVCIQYEHKKDYTLFTTSRVKVLKVNPSASYLYLEIIPTL